jgi:hypothetical protein
MRPAARIAGARWLAPIAVLGPWLLLLTSRQVALYPPASAPATELLPGPVALALLAAVVVLRLLVTSTVTHVVLLATTVCCAALFAAQLGTPLANASGDYCGDLCRTAIAGRFATFFGWPIVVAGLVAAAGRRKDGSTIGSAELAAWTRPWAFATLVLGLLASVAWWRIVLPGG